MQAQATTSAEVAVNLDGRIDGIDRTAVAFDPSDADTYSYANNVTLFDSQGNARTTTMYFTKLDSAPNHLGITHGDGFRYFRSARGEL